jgi:MFS family permease
LAAGGGSAFCVIVALVIFFGGFNAMEALLPSLVTKTAPAGGKGTATGIYSSAQFLGIFFGGAGGGWALAIGGERAVFGSALAVALVWLAVAATMRRPGRYRSQTVRLGDDALQQPGKLAELIRTAPGVVEVVVAADEGCAFLKIDPARFDAAAFDQIVKRQPADALADGAQGKRRGVARLSGVVVREQRFID